MNVTTSPRLTSLSHGAGCACKLSLDELLGVLKGITPTDTPDLLVGTATGDDAAVWNRPDGRALVATTDFFTPIVDDPSDWGRIAAANAVSDVYAMGARPLFALNVLGWPRDLSFDLLREVMAGAADVASAAGYVIAGGHSIDSVEPIYGQVVIGEVDRDSLLTNSDAEAGHVLVVTKPIGTGIVTTAAKRSNPESAVGPGVLGTAYRAAIASMTRLNDTAAATAIEAHASGATDVTGFGLVGHLHRLALASGVAARIDAGAVPRIAGAAELRDAGHVPGGTVRNADQAQRYLAGTVPRDELIMLADAQTSGGLLFACPPSKADTAVASLRDSGHTAAVIGELLDGPPGQVLVAA